MRDVGTDLACKNGRKPTARCMWEKKFVVISRDKRERSMLSGSAKST